MSAIIQITNLTQIYQNRKIINDLSLTVDEGEIFGFIGTNGAGKTATIRIMTTLLMPTHGEVLINGYSVKSSPKLVRKSIGYVPDQCGFYPDMTAWEYLDFFGACHEIHHRERPELLSTLLDLVDLSDQKDAQVEDLSLGMKQRLSLARALLHDPKALILDNPLSGLDPIARVEFQELLSEVAQMGKTIFLSSHILTEVTRICNHVGVMESGRLVAYGSVKELRTRLDLARTIQIKLIGQPEKVHAVLKSNPYISDISINEAQTEELMTTIRVQFRAGDEKIIELLTVLVRLGIQVLSFEVDTNEMEDAFSYITKGAVNF
jgi:ABC-2 type transport system ATP-binding protein